MRGRVSAKKLYVIHALDGADSDAKRGELYAAHRAYVSNHGTGVEVKMSGPLLDSDDPEGRPIGSLFLVEAGSLDEARSFNENDPFSRGGVWETVRIDPFIRRR